MSKVYSFRIENNPREAQAREVIDAWVTQGYSLRHIIVCALISYHIGDKLNDEIEEIISRVNRSLETMDEGGEQSKSYKEH
jgi:hypothetical protein